MPTETEFLKLNVFDEAEESSTFGEFRDLVAGTNSDSNMQIIDKKVSELSDSIDTKVSKNGDEINGTLIISNGKTPETLSEATQNELRLYPGDTTNQSTPISMYPNYSTEDLGPHRVDMFAGYNPNTSKTSIDLYRVDGNDASHNVLIRNVEDPTSPQHAATKNYVDTTTAFQFSLGRTTSKKYTAFVRVYRSSGSITDTNNLLTGSCIIATAGDYNNRIGGVWIVEFGNEEGNVRVTQITKESTGEAVEFGYWKDGNWIYIGLTGPINRGVTTITVTSKDGSRTEFKDFGDKTAIPDGWTTIPINQIATMDDIPNDIDLSTKVSKTGDAMTGPLAMSSNILLRPLSNLPSTSNSILMAFSDNDGIIINSGLIGNNKQLMIKDLNNQSIHLLGVDTPIDDNYAANKKYVDDTVNNYLPLSGGTLTGNLIFDNNANIMFNRENQNYVLSWQDNDDTNYYSKGFRLLNSATGARVNLTGIEAPKQTYDAVNKGYVDKLWKNAYVTFTVDGDADTYYPVLITLGQSSYAWTHVNICRYYNSKAPDTWNTSTHKGALTLCVRWTGDTVWGGNDHEITVDRFTENYCYMVGGLKVSTSGLVVWLRGGGAQYWLLSEYGNSPTVSVKIDGFTDGRGDAYSPREYDFSLIKNEIYTILKRDVVSTRITIKSSAWVASGNLYKAQVSSIGSMTPKHRVDFYMDYEDEMALSAPIRPINDNGTLYAITSAKPTKDITVQADYTLLQKFY